MTKAETKEPTTTAPVGHMTEPIAEAMAKVEKLARQEVERYEHLPIKKQELDSARNAQDFERAKAIREEVDWLADPQTGREERREAIVKLHLLQAQDLEEQAAVLRKNIDAKRASETDYLSHLQDQGDPDLEVRQRYFADRTATLDLITQATRLESEARLLRNQSKHGQVALEGQVSGTTAAELVEALMKIPDNLGPTISAIYEAVDNCKGRRQPGQRMILHWANSKVIDCDWQGIILGEKLKPRAQVA